MKDTTKSIWALRKEVESRSGKALRIYSAYPLIGRGSVKHTTLSHDQVEKRFEKAVHAR